MIKLTSSINEKSIFINPVYIIAVQDNGVSRTISMTTKEDLVVKESLDTIFRLMTRSTPKTHIDNSKLSVKPRFE